MRILSKMIDPIEFLADRDSIYYGEISKEVLMGDKSPKNKEKKKKKQVTKTPSTPATVTTVTTKK